MGEVPASVQRLERDLHGIFGSRLQSLVAYGLRARAVPHGHDGHSAGVVAVSTLAIVDQLSPDDLRACSSRVAVWHEEGLATPLLLASHEFDRSLDAFPFEFGEILADHVLVAGANPFDGLSIDATDLRHACEVQARGHLLHLREGFLETRGRADALAELVVHSAPAFATLVKSIARLQGKPSNDVGAAARAIEHALGFDISAAADIVALVGAREITSADAQRLFPPYLEVVERLVGFVDQWR